MPTLLPGLVLGFPPVHGGACGRGKPGALQEGPVAPAGVTASVPVKPTGISPVRHTSTSPAAPSHSTNLAAHQHAPPRSLDHHRRLTMEREARPTDLRGDSREQGAAKNSSHTGGTTSTALGGHRPDATIGAHQAHGPAEPKRTREAPLTTLQFASHRLRNPPQEPLLRPSVPPARPAQTQMGPKRAQIWAGRAPPTATASRPCDRAPLELGRDGLVRTSTGRARSCRSGHRQAAAASRSGSSELLSHLSFLDAAPPSSSPMLGSSSPPMAACSISRTLVTLVNSSESRVSA